MMKDQKVVALIANLIQDQGVSPEAIESAVNRCLDIKLGESIVDGDMLVRAFAMEQANRLLKKR